METAERKIFTLLDVCSSIKRTISARYTSPFWLRAEMHKLNYYEGSGHCFPELLQKDQNKIVAEMRAVFWRDDFARVSGNFLDNIGEKLPEGVELLMQVSILYEPRYGLSLHIIDIDPSYTLGQLQKEKLLCEQRLKKEGLWKAQQDLKFPLLPKRIAILSAVSSKGYSDFMQVIDHAPERNKFLSVLFPVVLQGEQALDTIPKALKHIEKHKDLFDVVVILRGGGSDVGLSVFNRYEIASVVARFPIPILCGIGHSTNCTITEEVSYFYGITPTQVGNFLWNYMENFRAYLNEYAWRINEKVKNILLENRRELQYSNGVFRLCLQQIRSYRKDIDAEERRLKMGFRTFCAQQARQLCEWERFYKLVNPQRWLKKGYSITLFEGKAITDSTELQAGAQVEIRFAKGSALAQITELAAGMEPALAVEIEPELTTTALAATTAPTLAQTTAPAEE